MTSPESLASQVTPARRNPRRRRRRRTIVTFLLLISAMVAAGVLALGNWVGWWTIGGRAQAAANICPVQTYTLPQLVKVNVYNGTTRRGLAGTVAREMQARRFQVSTIATAAQPKPLNAVAVIRYGQFGVQAARTVALQFPGKVSLVPDQRNTRTVDVVLGNTYTSMVDRAKAKKAIVLKPQPVGCVEPSSTATPSVSASP